MARWSALRTVAGAVLLACHASPSNETADGSLSLDASLSADASWTESNSDATQVVDDSGGSGTAGSSSAEAPIFDVGGQDESGTDSGPPPDMCHVGDGDLSGVGPCEDVAPPDSFDPEVQWSFTGPNGQIACMTSPLVANLTDDDGNGEINLCDTPDVVTVIGSSGETGPGNVVVLSGDDGTLLATFGQSVALGITPALGDIDNDGLVEIVSAEPMGHLVALEHDGTLKWTSTSVWAANQTGAVALADLDNDGDVEIVAGSNVFDHLGNLVFTAPFDGLYSASTAADLDGDGDLEAVFGHGAYHHDGTEYWVKPEIQMNVFSITSYPQVANLDADPDPEVLVATELGIWLLEHDGTTVWSNFAPTGESGDWNRPVNIHDFDGDEAPEFGISSYQHYGVYEVDQTPLFAANVVDFSGQAGGTAFDFLGSGIAQAIYADETQSFVFDIDGTILMMTPRSSGTWTEYPTVADIDNDGSAEILVGSDGNGSPTLQAIRDTGDRWIPARRIWNQHTYHVTNVREDGTIPQHEPPSWASLNTFRTQAQIAAGGDVCKPEPRG
ncbi:MAG TPA: VCBS repeat-containing protein [Nannocystaceae bacterium]|nr:VCBS repeat-containing protein [Nannocystaceae bacterium]